MEKSDYIEGFVLETQLSVSSCCEGIEFSFMVLTKRNMLRLGRSSEMLVTL